MIRLLIIDDEPPARAKLRRFLELESDMQILGEAADGPSALEAILTQKPDLVFLDIQMPGLTGLELLAKLPQEARPVVVFTTAYDEHAVQAFEENALDYLLKPFDQERFQKALTRVRKNVGEKEDVLQRLQNLLLQQAAPASETKPLAFREGGKVLFVQPEEIEFIESADKYVLLHLGEREEIIRCTMNEMQERLPKTQFKRIHRGFILRIACLDRLETDAYGEWEAVLKSGTRLKVGRKYKEDLLG